MPHAHKAIVIDGVHYRRRRGRLVAIPAEWVGQTTHWETMRKRPSKKVGTTEKERTRVPRPAERVATDDRESRCVGNE